MIDRSDWTEDELLATVAVVGAWNEGPFSMDYFLDMVDSAVQSGYLRWATQTEDLEDGKKRSRVVFIK